VTKVSIYVISTLFRNHFIEESNELSHKPYLCYKPTIPAMMNDMRTFFATGTTLNPAFRIARLKALRQTIRTYRGAIEEALHQDLGKSPQEAFLTEIQLVIDDIGHQIKHLKRWSQPKHVSSGLALFPSRCRVHYEPYGVVLIIAPWNYPFQLVMEPLVGALAAGNCAVLKPSNQTPHTAALIEKIIADCFEPTYVQVIRGDRHAMNSLLDQPFDYLFFTGSATTGRHIMQKAAAQLCPVTLELGGKSPCLVLPTADVSLAAKRIIFGKFINAGQTCVAPDYLLVHRSLKVSLLEALKTTLVQHYGPDPRLSPHYGRIVNATAFERLVTLLDASKQAIVAGGDFDREDRYIAPTLIDQPATDSQLMMEEIFGPLLPILAYDSLEEALSFINERPKPLALYVFGDTKTGRNVVAQTHSGGVCLNDTILHVANKHLPFGGVGESGMGSYHGRYSFLTFSHQKAVVSSSLWFDLNAKYPPYKGFKWLRRLLG